MQWRKNTPILLILLTYLVLGGLFAALTPDWQAPDEPAHYNYVRQLADGRLPQMALGDYDEAYKNEVVSSGFAPQYDISVITYEDWQPPLYYLVLTPMFLLTGGSLLALRLVSVLLGAGVILLAYGVARRLFPERQWMAWGTAVFVGFVPQHLAILASVNNDAMAELLIAGILFLLVGIGDWRLETERRRGLLLGVLLGLGYLTKGTVYPVTAVAGAALLVRYWGHWRQLRRVGLWVFGPALLLGALWWGRNLAVYGGLDVLGKAAHDAVVIGQPRTADLIAQVGFGGTLRQFVQTTFRSFWGQFGWMALPMLHPRWLYPLLVVFTVAVVAGLLVEWFRHYKKRKSILSNHQFLTLFLLFLLTLGVHVVYNFTFIQHQGRYLFPALIPMGVGVMVGLEAWIRPLALRWPLLLNLLPWGLAVFLAGLDIWALFRVIVPNL